MQKIGRIETLSKVDNKVLENEFILKDKPVIIKGGAKDWPAFKKWDVKYLIQNIGNKLVKFKTSNSEIFPNPSLFDKSVDSPIVESTFAKYLELLTQKNDTDKNNNYFLSGDEVAFVKNGLSNKNLDVIAGDFSLPSFISIDNLETTGLWVSKKGTASSIHYDSNGCHNINAQVKGSKHVVLFEPKEYKNLYMRTITQDLSYNNFSNVNWKKLDYNKFPNLKNVEYLEGTIEAGDIIFIPIFWLHYFDHLSEININVNFCWHPDAIKLNSISLVWLLSIISSRMLSNKDSNSKNTSHFLKNLEMTFNSWENGRPKRASN